MRRFYPLLKIIPFASIIGFIIGGASLRIGGYPLLPAFYLIPVYYWIIFSPQSLPLGSLVGLGLVYDSLFGNELGISSLLLFFSGLLGGYSRPLLRTHRFLLIWGIFGLYSFLFLCFYGLMLKGNLAFFFSWVYGMVLYPLASSFLNTLHLRLRPYV